MKNRPPRLTKADLRRLILAVILDPNNRDPRVLQIREELRAQAKEQRKDWLKEPKEHHDE